MVGNTAAGIVAMETGAKGPNFGTQTACATATHALGEALRLMRNGDADVMIAGVRWRLLKDSFKLTPLLLRSMVRWHRGAVDSTELRGIL